MPGTAIWAAGVWLQGTFALTYGQSNQHLVFVMQSSPSKRAVEGTVSQSEVAPRTTISKRLRAVLAVGILVAASGTAIAPHAAAQATAAPAAQPTLPRIQLTAGMHVIRAEVAAEPTSRARGLMFRERLGPNEGMLFVFERAERHCFWMRNTPLPLSIAFIDEAGTIINIENMQPRSDESHCPTRPARYALEMEQGWFAKRGISTGLKIGGLVQP